MLVNRSIPAHRPSKSHSRAPVSLLSAAIAVRAFLLLIIQHFLRDRCLQAAGALSYTALLSLVPLTAVVLGILSVFPVFEQVTEQIQGFVFDNFVPASGTAVQEYLLGFADKAKSLTAAGVLFLLVTAVMMLSTISDALNVIWKVRQRRRLLVRLLVYWALLTLGPVLIGVSLVATSYIVSLPLFSDVDLPRVRGALLAVTPWASATLAFMLLYVTVPDRRIGIVHALSGAAVAALLFELAKRGFAFYVTNFPTYQNIYGALAVIPIFLIWIYLSWIVVLLGAEFTYCLGNFRQLRAVDSTGASFVQAYRLLGVLWRQQQAGESLSLQRLARATGDASGVDTENFLEIMRKARLVHLVNGDNWALARDLDNLTLADFHQVLPFALPRAGPPQDAEYREGALHTVLDKARHAMSAPMSVSMSALYAEDAAVERPVGAGV